MKVKLIFVINLFGLLSLNSQSLESTNEFIVTGKVKQERSFKLSDLQHWSSIELNNINTSCSPKVEEKVNLVKGVLLKQVLDSVAFQYENRRMLNHFYFLFVASDGYKVLFSFNEIYNTEIGNNLYLIVEMNGKKAEELDNKIQILSTKDIKGGARNLKWLSRIVVGSAE